MHHGTDRERLFGKYVIVLMCWLHIIKINQIIYMDKNTSEEAAKRVAEAQEQLRKAQEEQQKQHKAQLDAMEKQREALDKQIEEHKKSLK